MPPFLDLGQCANEERSNEEGADQYPPHTGFFAVR